MNRWISDTQLNYNDTKKSNRVHIFFFRCCSCHLEQRKKTDIELIFITTNILSTADGSAMWRHRHMHKNTQFVSLTMRHYWISLYSIHCSSHHIISFIKQCKLIKKKHREEKAIWHYDVLRFFLSGKMLYFIK